MRIGMLLILGCAVLGSPTTADLLFAGEPLRITTDGRTKRDLVWLPQREELIFVQQDSPTLFAIYRLHFADRTAERCHPLAITSEFEPAFSGDGKLCAFVQSRGNLQLRLVIESVPPGTEAAVGPNGGFSGLRHPAIAPDGSRVIYSIPASGGQQLVSVNPQGLERRELTATNGFNTQPSFSADGSRIAFSSSRDEDFEIYTMRSDGSDSKRLTHSTAMDVRPVWSPDGKRLAFVSNRDGNYEIYLMDSDGGNLQNLTQHSDRDDFPAWHPDGKRLAFLSSRGGQQDIYLLDVP